MDVDAVDHPNLRVSSHEPVARARAFYVESLGLQLEGVDLYRDDEKPFFSVRLTPDSVIHLWPTDEFDAPDGDGFDHVCLRLAEEMGTVRDALDRNDVEVDERLDAPLGATGTAPSVYVTDPFGYRLELKAAGT